MTLCHCILHPHSLFGGQELVVRVAAGPVPLHPFPHPGPPTCPSPKSHIADEWEAHCSPAIWASSGAHVGGSAMAPP